jgi:uncharacterized protein (DUF1330 family)
MSAYVIVEITDKDEAAKTRYAQAAGPVVESFGGKFVARGPVTVLHGAGALERGLVIEFADRDAAVQWYESAEYQALIEVRNIAFDSRFVLIG